MNPRTILFLVLLVAAVLLGTAAVGGPHVDEIAALMRDFLGRRRGAAP